MPCCGITIEYLYARLKAAEIPGSGTADRLIDELLCADQSPTGEVDKAAAPKADPETIAS